MTSKVLSYNDCKEEAIKYKNVSDFLANAKSYFYRAYRMGWFNDITSHMKRYIIWSPELVAQEALKYHSRGEFSKYASGAYGYAKSKNILDKICSHMNPILIKWTKEMVVLEVSKYSTHKEFRLNSPKAYEAAKHNNWFDEISSHLKFAYKKGLPKKNN